MQDGPRNRASDRITEILPKWSDRQHAITVLAVRGERLALCVRGQTQDGAWTNHRLVVVQFDEEVERIERFVNFDLEQRSEAIEELERLHEATTA